MGDPTNYLTLTDAVIRNTTMPTGKAQHYLHDDKLPGLALRMRATGGRTWVYLFTKPGVKGTQRKTSGPGQGSTSGRHGRPLPSPLARWSRGSIRTTPSARLSGNS